MRKKVSEIIEAAEKNGYSWQGYGSPGRYCILQQVSLNLGLGSDWGHIARALDLLDRRGIRLGVDIYSYNDSYAHSYTDALMYLKEKLRPYKEETVEIATPLSWQAD